ncbi:hypothetical protein LOZ53_004440 [Ophidiomyces ophidiicola]|nr:hypothetical protein LOZ55_006174 [Ophidiomyces ophidiicola]KAI1985771.1 hypothetical protein LOZ54_004112 [Ophidiomyces ophidiicola]KAI1987194.1 hypothetical protein LOZ53_004440 [Ophidiomyces ophidiicola]KAI1998571.1 hypothetical protein LOZ51_002302 [Ophidiomyces ophidiicola]
MPVAAISAGTHRLVQRALAEMPRALGGAAQSTLGDDDRVPKIPPPAAAVLLATVVLFVLILASIQYTLGMVIPTLAVLEDPRAAVYVPVSDHDDNSMPKNQPGEATDHESLMSAGLITAKIRTTLRHLRARGGRLAPFRGLGISIVYCVCHSILTAIFSLHISRAHLLLRSFAAIAAQIALSGLIITWVHTVLTEPSGNSRPFWKHIPAFGTIKRVMPAVALQAVASQICFLVPIYLHLAIRGVPLDDFSKFPQPDTPTPGAIAGAAATLLLLLALTVLIDVPASVTMVRVAASTLSPDVDTIVPFDRTFNGKVEPAVLGGGCLGLLDAWKDFGWSSRIRLLKLLGKLVAITAFVTLIFVPILWAEIITFARVFRDQI